MRRESLEQVTAELNVVKTRVKAGTAVRSDELRAQVRLAEEQQFSAYSSDYADAASTRKQFDLIEAEASRLLTEYDRLKGKAGKRFPVLQIYDLCLKCSHLFNILDARGAISVTERAAMIGRVRKVATHVARAWLGQQGEASQVIVEVSA